MSKLISAAGFQLKGSGWYATDFKSSGAKPAAKANDEAKANGGEGKTDAPASAETKSESKSESKAETSSASSSSSGGCGSGCACH